MTYREGIKTPLWNQIELAGKVENRSMIPEQRGVLVMKLAFSQGLMKS
jgi:hypothetical protein